jgi:hypothetical protein
MDNALLMGVRERRTYLDRYFDGLVQVLGLVIAQGHTFDHLHDNEGNQFIVIRDLGLGYIMDGDDIGVIQPGSGARFLQQPGTAFGSQTAGGNDLDGHRPFQQGVLSPVNDAHAAAAEFGFYQIAVVQNVANHKSMWFDDGFFEPEPVVICGRQRGYPGFNKDVVPAVGDGNDRRFLSQYELGLAVDG